MPGLSTLKHHAAAYSRLRVRAPRIHAITSPVAAERTANTLLALGCTPTLTVNPEEIAAFVAASDAILVNLGMLDPLRMEAASRAFVEARTLGRPLVLDPVFTNLSQNRSAFARDLLTLRPTVLKANGAEADIAAHVPPGTVTVITGTTDILRQDDRQLTVGNGHPLATQVTAMGCALGAVIAAMLVVEEDALLATTTAVLAYGIAGDRAGARATGPGSFAFAFLDELAALQPTDIERHGKLN